jgi:hypothetical protein
VSLNLCRDAPYSGATQGTMPSFHFYDFFKKLFDNCVAIDHTSERFF